MSPVPRPARLVISGPPVIDDRERREAIWALLSPEQRAEVERLELGLRALVDELTALGAGVLMYWRIELAELPKASEPG